MDLRPSHRRLLELLCLSWWGLCLQTLQSKKYIQLSFWQPKLKMIFQVPKQGILGITEKCFNQGHMEFFGNTTWISTSGKWRAIPATRTRVNTVPANSEWALTAGFKNVFKDRVQVPDNIPLGDYVLSFRWDCRKSAQIWHSCANIRIVDQEK